KLWGSLGVPRFSLRGRGAPGYLAANPLGAAVRWLTDGARTLLCPQASVPGWTIGSPGGVGSERLDYLGHAHPEPGTARRKRLRGRPVDRCRTTGRVALRGGRGRLERGPFHPPGLLEWRSVEPDRPVRSTCSPCGFWSPGRARRHAYLETAAACLH